MAQNRFSEAIVALFRVVVGLLFGLHGAAALFGVLGGAMGSGQPVPAGLWPDWWAAAIQFAAGFLVLLGLGTRFFAVIASGSMAYAYFVVHQPNALLPMHNGGDLPVLFCWSFLVIAAIGPGRYALDRLFRRSSSSASSSSSGSSSGSSSSASDKELTASR
jgi:putative oxidoreductase